MRRIVAPFVCLLVLSVSWVAPAGGTFEQEAAPADLRPLLAQPQSEMRMVVQRYTLDRVDAVGELRQRRRAVAADAAGAAGMGRLRRRRRCRCRRRASRA